MMIKFKTFFRLHKFAKQWLETNIISNKYRERIWMRWQKWGQKMQAAFDRPTCGYFDPEKPNDGDPTPNQNHKLATFNNLVFFELFGARSRKMAKTRCLASFP